MQSMQQDYYNKTIHFKYYALLIIMIIVQCSVISFFAIQKHNLMVDELWTFNLANSNYFPFLGSASDIFNQWLTNSFWYKHITVETEKIFNFGAVFYNQAKDVHPPFYYMIIHFVCSLFSNEFSKWFGIIPNMVFFAMTQFVLFKISNKFFDDIWHSFFPCLIYGFSWGAINTVIFIRMYMMLTFFCVLSFYLHLVIKEQLESGEKYMCTLLQLFFTMLSGFMTQYYFLIYQTFLSSIFLLYWYFCKNLIFIRRYLAVLCSVFIVSVVIFPSWLRHILGSGYRGKEAIRNLANSSLIDNFIAFLRLVNRDIFAGWGNLLLIILTVIVLYKIGTQFWKISLEKEGHRYSLVITANRCKSNYSWCMSEKTLFMFGISIFIFFYFLIVSKIAPFKENRYIYNIYPFVALLLYYGVYCKVDFQYKKISMCMLVTMLFVGLTAVSVYRVKNIKFIDRNFEKIHSQINTEAGIKQFIYIGRDHSYHRITSQVLDLAKVSKSYLILEKDINEFKWDELDDRVFVYRAGNCAIKASDLEEQILSNSKFKNFKKTNRELGTIYEFY